ncbi:MAG: hypothetical protein AAF800_11280 [Planctomycetota bacterium]
MSELRSSYDLSQEIARETQRPKGQGDGWTLDQHLIEHRRLPSAVSISDTPKILICSHATPGRAKFWVALGVLVVGAVGAFVAGVMPPLADFGVMHWAIGLSIVSLLVATCYASFAHTRMGLNHVGLVARPWPPVPGIGVAVPLKQVRRFKVNKVEEGGQVKHYELQVLTREGEAHRIVPNVPLKRDAYLLAMLLIDRVKKLRGDTTR